MPRTLAFTPRLMQAPAAAHYLGVSVSKLRSLPVPARKSGRNVLYDINDLDRYADGLPYESGSNHESEGGWEAAFD